MEDRIRLYTLILQNTMNTGDMNYLVQQHCLMECLVKTLLLNIGDQFQIGSSGSAKVIAIQPRMPCYKLGVKFGRMDIIRRFLASGRPGIYFKVLREGEIE